jgi:hypothetical protein
LTSFDKGQVAVFADASASYQQPGFEAAKAIDGDAAADSGWAIAGGQGRDHYAVFRLAKPFTAKSLRMRLEQTYSHHPIGRFRISVTDAADPVAALPDDIAKIVATSKAAATLKNLLCESRLVGQAKAWPHCRTSAEVEGDQGRHDGTDPS